MKNMLKNISLVALFFCSSTIAMAQYKANIKNCIPQLKPYTYTDELNKVKLVGDDTTELVLTFFEGQDYRILLCAPPELGNIEFKISDMNGNLLFSNKDHFYTPSWNFKVNETDNYFIQMSLANSNGNVEEEIPLQGSVAVLLGFKL